MITLFSFKSYKSTNISWKTYHRFLSFTQEVEQDTLRNTIEVDNIVVYLDLIVTTFRKTGRINRNSMAKIFIPSLLLE